MTSAVFRECRSGDQAKAAQAAGDKVARVWMHHYLARHGQAKHQLTRMARLCHQPGMQTGLARSDRPWFVAR